MLIILFNNKEVIVSSHKSGFYLKPFKLSLTTNNKYTIHYTVDGSNPSTISKIFETKGEDYFRKFEEKITLKILKINLNFVVSYA